jgi:hypothetical protein
MSQKQMRNLFTAEWDIKTRTRFLMMLFMEAACGVSKELRDFLINLTVFLKFEIFFILSRFNIKFIIKVTAES